LKSHRAQASQATAAQLEAEAKLATAQRDFIAQLAKKDRAYAEEIAVFRGQVTDIASTPEGAEALAMFNGGDELGALAILDKLRAANDAARDRRAAIESAAEGRRIAALALEARAKGKLKTSAVIARYEDVVARDPGVFWDWIELRRLYRDAGRLADARVAAEKAIQLADGERNRLVALRELADVQLRSGAFAKALQSTREGVAIARRLAATRSNDLTQRDLSVSLNQLGLLLERSGDLDGALNALEEGLTIDRFRATNEPDNLVAQRDVAIALAT